MGTAIRRANARVILRREVAPVSLVTSDAASALAVLVNQEIDSLFSLLSLFLLLLFGFVGSLFCFVLFLLASGLWLVFLGFVFPVFVFPVSVFRIYFL